MDPLPQSRPHESIPGLMRQLAQDGDQLVRAELRLAQAKATGRARRAVPGLIAIAIGGTFLFASMFTLLAALIGWLAPRVGPGNAALIVTIGTALTGGVLVAFGASRLKNPGGPPHAEAGPAADPKDAQP